jgi:hypothetical protein
MVVASGRFGIGSRLAAQQEGEHAVVGATDGLPAYVRRFLESRPSRNAYFVKSVYFPLMH